MVPLLLRNMRVEKQPQQANKESSYSLHPMPGLVEEVDLIDDVRGIFAKPGVQDGTLYAVAGTTAYSISNDFVETSIGTVSGLDDVEFDGLRTTLLILGGGELKGWDGSTLTTVTDPNFPTGATSLAVLGQRAVCNDPSSDTFAWSETLDFTTWPALGFATSETQPDRVLAHRAIGGRLFSFGETSIQPYNLGGGSDEEAFENFSSVTTQNRGILNLNCVALVDDGAFMIGDDRVLYQLNGFTPKVVPHPQLQKALGALTTSEVDEVRLFSFQWEDRPFVVANLPTSISFQYDVRNEIWTERTTFSAALFEQFFSTRAYGKTIVAGRTTSKIWSLSDEVYSDAGSIMECSAMLRAALQSPTAVDSFQLDAELYGQPTEGQGVAPQCIIKSYRDGGKVPTAQRFIDLPALGHYGQIIRATGFGQFQPRNGAIFQFTRTDPFGFALNGAWINEARK